VKIIEVELYQIEIPPIPAIAKYMPKIYDLTLVRLSTDEGLTGWGESQGLKRDLETNFSTFVGQDPLALDPFAQHDAITCALLDIAGQAWGVPVHRFFGARIRDRVPVSYWSCHMEPAETATQAEIGAKLGFTNHKLKARPWDIVETVRLMREAAGPQYTVGVDPNTLFEQPSNAARLAAELEPFGTVANLEDPVLKDNLDWFRLLREKTWIPIALHLGSPAGVLAALKAEAVDHINLGGSAVQIRRSAALAEAANIPVWVQMGGLCLGVKAAYSVHLQSTLPNATLPCDELPFTRVADVCDGSLELEAGHFLVPDRPGLGISVNLDIVEKYRVA
jgi:L-alanine-DL-glutamate epimerase-like enolase superfamily enzyme